MRFFRIFFRIFFFRITFQVQWFYKCWRLYRKYLLKIYQKQSPIWVRHRICLPFPCVSYETTKRVSQWQQVYGVGLRRPPVQPLQSRLKRPGCQPKTLPLFSNLSSLIPTQPLLNMVQYVADWIALFCRSQHSPPSPLKFFHTSHSPPFYFPPSPLFSYV